MLRPLTRRVVSALKTTSATQQLRTFASTLDVSSGLSEDQIEFQDLARDFAATEFAPHVEKWDNDKFFPQDAIRKAAELGFGGLYVDPEFGGTGLGRVDASVIFEQLSAADVSTTAYITIHNMCAWMIDQFGSQELKQKYLPGVCSMELFASYCLTEAGAGSDAGSLQTKAVRDGDDFLLTGSKAFISGGGTSDVYLVMARTGHVGSGPGGISCFLVPSDAPGLSFGAQESKMGWNTQPTCEVIMDNCRVSAANMLGQEGQGFKIAMKGLDGGRINIATCSLGAAQASLDLARDHVLVRKQFGKTLAANQSVQFKLADMAVKVQSSRLMIRNAAKMLDAKDPQASMHCAMAKIAATDQGFEVCNDALQLHGGYGYIKDYPLERFVRDVRVHQILEGTNEVMRMIVSRQVLKTD